MKTIIVTVTDDCEVEVKTSGFKGKACQTDAAVAAVKAALGQSTKETPTAEMHASQTQGNRRTL